MKTLLEHQRETGKLPPALKRRVKLKDEDRVYWEAFHDLSGSRQVGENFGPIPVSEILAWFEMFGISLIPEREAILKRIRRLDDAYVKHTMDKRAAELERQKAKK